MPNEKKIIDYGELNIDINPSSPTIGIRSPYKTIPASGEYPEQTPYGLGYPYINTPPTDSETGNLFDYMSSVCDIRAQHVCTMGPEYETTINEFQDDTSVFANDTEINIGFGKDVGFVDFYNSNATSYHREVIGYQFGIQKQTGASTDTGKSERYDSDNYYDRQKLIDILGENQGYLNKDVVNLITYTNKNLAEASPNALYYDMPGGGYIADNEWRHDVNPSLWNSIDDIADAHGDDGFSNLAEFYNSVKSLLTKANQQFFSYKNIEIRSPNNVIDPVDGNNTTETLATIEGYGNVYENVGDNTGNIDIQEFEDDAGGVRFRCQSKCDRSWNPDNFPSETEVDNVTFTEGEAYQSYDDAIKNDEGQPWWRCACDPKVFAITQWLLNRYYPNGNENGASWLIKPRTVYFLIQPQGGLELFGEYYPYVEEIEYITGIQNNGEIIDYDAGEQYNPYVEVLESIDEYGDSNNESSDFDITKFGHPDFDIKQTLLNSYNPYMGIDMTTSNLCSHIEFMYAPEVSWPGDINYEKSETLIDEDSWWTGNWGDGVYYRVDGEENINIYKDIIPEWYNSTNLSTLGYNCNTSWTYYGLTVEPVKEINVVCNNGKKLNICESIDGICDGNTFKYRNLNGEEICQQYAESQNSELLFSENKDGRIPLGLYYFDEYDYIDDNINVNSDSDEFEFQEPIEFIKNGGGAVQSEELHDTVPGIGAEGWAYFVRDGVNSPTDSQAIDGLASYYKLGNLENEAYKDLFIQQNPETGQLYSGYHPYCKPVKAISYNSGVGAPYSDGLTGDMHNDMEWARWIKSKECYSHEKCLQFSASSNWQDTELMIGASAGINSNEALGGQGNDTDWSLYNFRQVNYEQYRTINQVYKFNSGDLANLDYDSELKVSFMMKTLSAPLTRGNNFNHFPRVEAFIYCPGTTDVVQPAYGNPNSNYAFPDVSFIGNDAYAGGAGSGQNGNSADMYVDGTINQYGLYNSLHPSQSINITGEEGYSAGGGKGIFENSALNTWEKFSFSFKLAGAHKNQFTSEYIESQIIKDLAFVINAYSGEGGESTNGDFADFQGEILLDQFSVKESFDFTPDVYVTPTLGSDVYFPYQLTTYHDAALLTEEELKTVQAPLKVSFYFYPRHKSNFVFDVEKDINYKDFKLGKFSIYNVDWGDGEKDYQDEPKKIDYGTLINHYYKKSGIYTITGYMLRVKTKYQNSENDINTLGLSKIKRFKLKIYILEGSDEDFTYFNTDGFSFIPYKNTLPVIGGVSKESYYYKSILRQLGFVSNEKINLNFLDSSDQLKTELALLKMDTSKINDLKLLQSMVIPRTLSLEDELGGGVIVTPEYLGTLPYPQYYDEFINSDISFLNNGSYWSNRGRPDIAIFVYFVALDGIGFNNSNNYQLPQYVYDWIDNFSTFESLPGDTPQSFDVFHNPTATIFDGFKIYPEELGKSIGDCDLTNIKFYETPKSIYELLGFEGQLANTPNNPRYWKNIIPKDYSIFNRDGINDDNSDTPDYGDSYINIYSEQEWTDVNENLGFGYKYYYPVLPKYGADGKFLQTIDSDGNYIPNTYPNNKISFPLNASITNENDNDKNLNINIISEQFDTDVLNDSSGNKNIGFTFGDYKPKFDNKNLTVKNIKKTTKLKISKDDEAF